MTFREYFKSAHQFDSSEIIKVYIFELKNLLEFDSADEIILGLSRVEKDLLNAQRKFPEIQSICQMDQLFSDLELILKEHQEGGFINSTKEVFLLESVRILLENEIYRFQNQLK